MPMIPPPDDRVSTARPKPQPSQPNNPGRPSERDAYTAYRLPAGWMVERRGLRNYREPFKWWKATHLQARLSRRWSGE
jgi:hypothetical protein